MKALEQFQQFVAGLDPKAAYKYLAIALGIITLLVGLMIYRYYSKTHTLLEQITTINDERDRIKRIIVQADRVKKQRTEVDSMIAENEGFKIGGYFNAVLAKLHLSDKKTVDETAYIDHEGKYRESILKAKLVDMNMKDVCDLLNELDQNKRIFTKELELVAVKKNAHPTLDVSLTIGTLEPKSIPKE